ncbi:hypothetical protein [Bradyrhizobium genosp. SA-3]|uniref:hypothetical protein n=1 Tax=Bradyrhizobium genosp. SA-3 TaxID=508868 RepID=UPI0013EEE5CD|nr:hypothetical protein [Bradyrhizobium genosp. SA-3]
MMLETVLVLLGIGAAALVAIAFGAFASRSDVDRARHYGGLFFYLPFTIPAPSQDDC